MLCLEDIMIDVCLLVLHSVEFFSNCNWYIR